MEVTSDVLGVPPRPPPRSGATTVVAFGTASACSPASASTAATSQPVGQGDFADGDAATDRPTWTVHRPPPCERIAEPQVLQPYAYGTEAIEHMASGRTSPTPPAPSLRVSLDDEITGHEEHLSGLVYSCTDHAALKLTAREDATAIAEDWAEDDNVWALDRHWEAARAASSAYLAAHLQELRARDDLGEFQANFGLHHTASSLHRRDAHIREYHLPEDTDGDDNAGTSVHPAALSRRDLGLFLDISKRVKDAAWKCWRAEILVRSEAWILPNGGWESTRAANWSHLEARTEEEDAQDQLWDFERQRGMRCTQHIRRALPAIGCHP